MPAKVTKAVIAAAGLGTRFLPMTKAMPKEMLAIIDKPIIQYVVEEAVAAGITDIIIVGSANKRAIEDHFDHQYELENKLRQDGKHEMADRMEQVAELANFVYLRQKGPYGTATPVLNAMHLLNDEPFLFLYADDFFRSDVPRAVSLVDTYNATGKSVIALTPMAKGRAKSYGIADVKHEAGPSTFELKGLIEKPEPDEAPHIDGTIFASTAGQVLTPDIFPLLYDLEPNPKNGEMILADAINQLAAKEPVYGRVIDGQWHDCGNKEKYLEAIVDVALADEHIAPSFAEFLKAKLEHRS
ncbi:MAG TPA: UTP--glucose-1-phosphate uridylyltransferase [Candidatus Saccharimonadia bacterium]